MLNPIPYWNKEHCFQEAGKQTLPEVCGELRYTLWSLAVLSNDIKVAIPTLKWDISTLRGVTPMETDFIFLRHTVLRWMHTKPGDNIYAWRYIYIDMLQLARVSSLSLEVTYQVSVACAKGKGFLNNTQLLLHEFTLNLPGCSALQQHFCMHKNTSVQYSRLVL